MSLLRFFADRAALYRAKHGVRLPSGEQPVDLATMDQLAPAIPCRIAQASEADMMRLGANVAAVGSYTALLATDTNPQPKVNDRLVRQADGQQFTVVGWPDMMGDAGHAMAHLRLPLRRVG